MLLISSKDSNFDYSLYKLVKILKQVLTTNDVFNLLRERFGDTLRNGLIKFINNYIMMI
jgi:hypothetical protein